MGEADARFQWENAGGSAPEHWNFCFFGDLLETPTSITVGVMYPGGDMPNGIPLVKVNDVKNGQIQAEPTYCVSEEVDEQYKKTRLNGSELIITLVGEPGDCVVADSSMEGWNVARALAVARLKDPSIRPWIRHVLLSAPAKHLIDARLNTTVQKTLNLKDVKQLGIPLPPKEERDSISSVVGSLDDKIELNRRMNATLEGMAQALFKSWFVDFDPVIDNALAAGNSIPDELAPRAEVRKKVLANGTTQQGSVAHPTLSDHKSLFPAAFQFTEELGWIPEGWKAVKLQSVCDRIISGGTPRTNEPDYWNGSIPWLSSGETGQRFILATEKTISQNGVENSSARQTRKGAVVIASAGQGKTRGQTSYLCFDSYINQSVIALESDNSAIPDSFLFFDLARRYEEFRQISDAHSSRGSLTTKLLAEIDVVVPTGQQLSDFGTIAGDAIRKITASARQTSELLKLRDTLLPKLISGELRLPEVEPLTEGVLA